MGQDALRKEVLAVRAEAQAEQDDLFAAIDEVQDSNELLKASLNAEKQASEALTAHAVTAERDLAVMTERAKATTSNLDKMEARRNELEKDLLDARVALTKEQSNHARTNEKLKSAEDLILKLKAPG